MIEYKFIRCKCSEPDEQITAILNSYAKEGWKLSNYYPTSDMALGRNGFLDKNEAWDVGYVFVFSKEI